MWNPGFRAIRRHQGSFGEIHLTIRYATLRNKLIIVVDACRFLANLFSVWLLKGCAQVFMVPLFPAGTCSPAARTARTRTPAFICSQISPGDIAKRHM